MPAALVVVVPLVAFFALGLTVVLLVWRVTVVAGKLRQESQFQKVAGDLARRAEASLSELLAVVDGLRRGKAPADAVVADVAQADEAVARYLDEAAVIDTNETQAHVRASLVDDLERAARAISLIEHGRGLMAGGAFEKAQEGETAVKRGYLNLLHAREALRGRIDEIERLQEPRPRRQLLRRRAG